MWDFFKTVFTGRMHINENDLCQDCAEYTVTQDGIYVAALADGASGSRFGDIAAKCNVHAVLNYFHRVSFNQFCDYPKDIQCNEIINSCVSLILKTMRNLPGTQYSDFCATLLFVVSDGEKFIIGHLGDGLICSYQKDKTVKLLSQPDNIDFDSTRTYFTLSNNANKHIAISDVETLDDIQGIIMMSDGPELSFYDNANQIVREKNLQVIMDDIAYQPCRDLELTYYLKHNFFEYGITGDDCSMLVFVNLETR